MKRDFFDFGDHSAVIGALAVVAFVFAANLGFFLAREFGKDPNRNSQNNQQVSRQLDQEQRNNRPDL